MIQNICVNIAHKGNIFIMLYVVRKTVYNDCDELRRLL